MKNSKSPFIVGLALLTATAGFAWSGNASAKLTVCNQTGQQLFYTFTVDGDSSCGGSTQRMKGWFLLNNNQCVDTIPGSVKGRTIWEYAILADGSAEFAGPESWLVPQFNHDGCWEAGQLACVFISPPTRCAERRHTKTFSSGADRKHIYRP